MVYFGELLINGALVGLMYGLVALGFVLIYKASGVVNLAQGSLVMLGAYLYWYVQSALGSSWLLSIAICVAIMICLGFALERWLLRPLVGQPIIMVVMFTLGIDILLRGLVPSIFGSSSRSIDLGIPFRPFAMGDLFINRSYLLGGAIAVVLVILTGFLFRTRSGIKLQAVSNNHVASWAVGISVERVIGVTWALAGVIALCGGILWGSVQGVDWTLSTLLLPALAVIILGGFDSLLGVLFAGLIVGILGSVIPGYLDSLIGSSSRDVVTSTIILLVILIRPHGLFGREMIERI